MRKLLSVLLCLLIGVGLATAQTTKVSGVVISAEDGEPVIGASVIGKGTTIGTVTNFDGQFNLDIPQSCKLLTVSFVGMKTQEVEVRSKLRIVLESASEELDEVLVVAYGTAKKSSFTGSAAMVKSEKISSRAVSNAANALSGQVAGVQVVNSSGQPGSSPVIRIRGIGSMSASRDPLYVVDGVPFDGNIASINPQDIESMSVLKDAAANAIYGARGANGVVLITTKKANTKEAVINVDAKWGTNRRAVPTYDVIESPGLYYETFFKSMYNSRKYAGKTDEESYAYANKNFLNAASGGLGYQVFTVPEGENIIGTDLRLNPKAVLGYSDGTYYYTPDNWYDEIFDNNNLRQEYNVSVAGSTDKINTYLSVGYLDDSGITDGSGFSRYTGRLRLDYQAKKWMKVGANVGVTHYNIKEPGGQTDWGSSGNLFYVSNLMGPIYPLYVRNADGSIKVDEKGITVYDFGAASTNFKRPFMSMSNPAITLKLDKTNGYTDIINSKWYAIFTPIEGLSITANFAANMMNKRTNILYNQYYGGSVGSKGLTYVEHERDFGVNQQYLVNYRKEFADKHNVEILAGYEAYSLKMQELSGKNKQLYNPNVGELSNAIGESPEVKSQTNTYTTEGVLVRLQYDYDGKYFLSGSYRRDASSRFHPDNRWGNFGSVGAAWLMSNESFMQDLTWINMLKVKASYGVQGNDNLLNYYPYLDQFTVQNSDGDFAVAFSYKGNKDITWETSYSFNAGVDFELFKSRLTGTIEFFNRDTKDLLYNQPVPVSFGYSSKPMNVGKLRNRGVEFDLNGVLFRNRNILWTLNLNGTHFKNKILDLAQSAIDNGGIKGSNYIYRIGGSLYNTYMRQYAGVDQETGKAQYYIDPDNGDYTITTEYTKANQSDLGSTLPKLYGGFGTTVNAYGFDFSVQFAYQLGGKLYDGTYEALMHTGDLEGQAWHKDILKAWTPENRSASVPRLNNADVSSQYQSSRFLVSSNYLSLNNIMLGYTLPKKWMRAAHIENIRVYLVGDNLALLSTRKGFDPRTGFGLGSSTTSGSFSYSAVKTFSGGVTLTF